MIIKLWSFWLLLIIVQSMIKDEDEVLQVKKYFQAKNIFIPLLEERATIIWQASDRATITWIMKVQSILFEIPSVCVSTSQNWVWRRQQKLGLTENVGATSSFLWKSKLKLELKLDNVDCESLTGPKITKFVTRLRRKYPVNLCGNSSLL